MYKPCNNDGFPSYTNTTCYYTSDLIHTVKISGLKPGRSYKYRPVTKAGVWRHFKTPPALGSPIKFGFTADMGQTADSKRTMEHMKAAVDSGDIQSIIFPGDLAYADGYAQAWDNWGRLSEQLLGAVPSAFGAGNHEYTNGYENFVSFTPRYGWPTDDSSGNASPLWYSFEAGMAHVIMLCSYCDFAVGSVQEEWLQRDLNRVDRARTPWVIAAFHTPWYTSSKHHNMDESEPMRDAMEDTFYSHKVDFVVSGHVHAYERTLSVYKNKTTCDGPAYITIGDGGNHEGPACGWEQEELKWSARREYSFGYGVLDIQSETEARWTWHRNQDGVAMTADMVVLKPASKRCEISEATLLV